MKPSEVREVVEQTAKLVESRYVFPAAGAEIARALSEMTFTATDPSELAAEVTVRLQAENGDKHLRLVYSDEEFPEDNGDDTDDDSADFAQIVRMAGDSGGGVAKVGWLEGRVAYLAIDPLLFPTSLAAGQISAAMHLVASADALILDLRECLGGDPQMTAFLATYLFGEEPVHLSDIYERKGDRTRQVWTHSFVPGPRFGGEKPIFVLTSAKTFSGGEDLAYTLQQHGRATIIGEATRGGAHLRDGFRVHPHLMATIPVARSINLISGTNWEGVGVLPELAVPAGDALDVAIGEARNRKASLTSGDSSARAPITAGLAAADSSEEGAKTAALS